MNAGIANAERAPRVSVVIPARDAAATLGGALASLHAQTCAAWEAIVVDDASRDDTRAMAERAAAADWRLRVLPGPGRGAGAARNAGIAAARAPWLLFLDADDAIAPAMLERMLDALDADPAADAAHCGWVWTDAHDAPLAEGRCEQAGDLFPLLARYCAFVMGACVVRRVVVEEVGGFDPALRTSEDFDLWQRVARGGARFAAVPATLVRYRLRRDASWFDAPRFLRDGLAVIARGHAPDPRVPAPAPAHADGAPADDATDASYLFATWAAAMAATRGGDAAALLALVPHRACPTLSPDAVSAVLLHALPLVACLPPPAFPAVWPGAAAAVRGFLARLEARTGAAGLATRVVAQLEDAACSVAEAR